MGKYDERRWTVPSKRAKSYAEERKAKVHQHGPKEGKELTDYEAGMRSGYLQCQSGKRAKNSRTTKRVCVPGIFSVSPIMPAPTSTRRLSRKGSPRRKPSAFPDRKAKPRSKIGRI